MSADTHFTRDNLDKFLNELAKQFKKINGKYATAELILIGGAAVLVNYDFRNMTNDIDAIINSTASLKEAINIVGDKFSLPNFWLNSDFTRTSSYSPKLTEVSKYYKTFSNVISVRTVTGEYLIAMKLISGRQYKNDISDIIGIVHEEREQGREITAEGKCEGFIGFEEQGNGGFGYDPVFMVGDISYSQMSPEAKDAISHRGSALRQLKDKIGDFI